MGLAIALMFLLTAGACGPVLDEGPRPASRALAAPAQTTLGRAVAAAGAQAAADTGAGQALPLSGFAVVETGAAAFTVRRRLIAQAERTLDVQYFIWEPDVAGLTLLAALAEAADRGVRVRLLLDDLYQTANAPHLALLDSHPNAAVRLYNPARDREARRSGFVTMPDTFNHRMHNKALIADNAVGVIGGRNISDKYFVVDPRSNFRDLDLRVAGPVVTAISASFDAYWNHPLSVRLNQLREVPAPTTATGAGIAGRLWGRMAGRPSAQETLDRLPRAPDGTTAPSLVDDLIWAPAVMIADPPQKPLTGRPAMMRALLDLLGDRPRKELLFEIAYVVPEAEGLAYLCGLIDRGARVRGLTNSFASNDLLVTHSGYLEYRRALIDCGVELHELRADAAEMEGAPSWRPPRSDALLHTKAMVFDDRWTLISSLNFDPRSIELNTELGVLIDSPRLSAQVSAFIESGMRPDNAYHVALEDGDMVWRTRRDGKSVRLTREPQTDLWDRALLRSLAALPLEGML